MSGQLTKADYPPNWGELRAQARARDGHACACIGECGSTHDGRCGAPNDAEIVRDPDNLSTWYLVQEAPRYLTDAHYWRVVRVMLSTAHLCHDSTCDDLEHLRSMCQRCHLTLDGPQHARNAAQTRQRQKEASGQIPL